MPESVTDRTDEVSRICILTSEIRKILLRLHCDPGAADAVQHGPPDAADVRRADWRPEGLRAQRGERQPIGAENDENLKKKVGLSRSDEAPLIHGNKPGRSDGGAACNDDEQVTRRKRSVWTTTLAGFSWEMCRNCKEHYPDGAETDQPCRKCGAQDWVAHFAIFPEALVVPGRQGGQLRGRLLRRVRHALGEGCWRAGGRRGQPAPRREQGTADGRRGARTRAHGVAGEPRLVRPVGAFDHANPRMGSGMRVRHRVGRRQPQGDRHANRGAHRRPVSRHRPRWHEPGRAAITKARFRSRSTSTGSTPRSFADRSIGRRWRRRPAPRSRTTSRTDYPNGARAVPPALRDSWIERGWIERVEIPRIAPTEPTPCTVLDPFAGSGTTGVVALVHGRDFVGVELNGDYALMAGARIQNVAPLFNKVEICTETHTGEADTLTSLAGRTE